LNLKDYLGNIKMKNILILGGKFMTVTLGYPQANISRFPPIAFLRLHNSLN
jgi:hypothetical protein